MWFNHVNYVGWALENISIYLEFHTDELEKIEYLSPTLHNIVLRLVNSNEWYKYDKIVNLRELNIFEQPG